MRFLSYALRITYYVFYIRRKQVDSSRSASTVNTNVSSQKRGSCLPWVILLLVLLGGGGATAYLGGTFALRQKTPTGIEASMADAAKRLIAVQPEFKDWQMPASANDPASIAKGRELFATECALCHGNTGKGDAFMGKNMFPPAADLTDDRAQSKTPGELFWLIAHGMNYTGMPGWGQDYGGSHNQAEIWNLVAFIRTLKK